MKKKGIWVIVSVLVVFGLLLGGFGCAAPTPVPTPTPTPTPTPALKAVTLKVASVVPPPESSMHGELLKAWEDMVTDRTNGKITFKNYWACALGKPAEHLTLVEKGTVDLVFTSALYTPGKLPLQDYEYAFPFGPTDPHVIGPAKRQIFEEFSILRDNLAKQNAAKICLVPTCTFSFTSREPITKLDEFEGKKCAVIGRWFGQWVGAIGAVPVTLPGQERYTALQTGVIETSFNPIDWQYQFKDIEVAPYVLDPEIFISNTIAIWINLDTLHSLPEDIQNLLFEAGKDVEKLAADEVQPKWMKKVWEEWEKDPDFQYYKLSAEEKAEWAAKCPDTPAVWAAEMEEKGYPGWEIVKRYQELCAERGFKWMREWGVKQ